MNGAPGRSVLVSDEAGARAAAHLAERSGRRVVTDREVVHDTPWSLVDDQPVIAVSAAARSEDVLELAVRGAMLIVIDDGLTDRFREALHRASGVIEWQTEPLTRLEPIELELLARLAAGATLQDAAGILHLSVRTAHRRLANCRTTIGVATTAEALRHYMAASAAWPG